MGRVPNIVVTWGVLCSVLIVLSYPSLLDCAVVEQKMISVLEGEHGTDHGSREILERARRISWRETKP